MDEDGPGQEGLGGHGGNDDDDDGWVVWGSRGYNMQLRRPGPVPAQPHTPMSVRGYMEVISKIYCLHPLPTLYRLGASMPPWMATDKARRSRRAMAMTMTGGWVVWGSRGYNM